jgi:hypothetical protein
MKITEKVTKRVPETYTVREYLQFRENWGKLELDATEYLLMMSENGELVLNKPFDSRAKARKYALKQATKYKGKICFTVMKNNQIIERMEI